MRFVSNLNGTDKAPLLGRSILSRPADQFRIFT